MGVVGAAGCPASPPCIPASVGRRARLVETPHTDLLAPGLSALGEGRPCHPQSGAQGPGESGRCGARAQGGLLQTPAEPCFGAVLVNVES